MGVAKLNCEYRLTDNNGLLDFPKTLENIKTFMNLINHTQKEISHNIN